MSKPEDKLLEHSYDGIQEFDNPLPPWWVGLFGLTVVWGVIYFIFFHIVGLGGGQLDELKNEYAEAEANKPKQTQNQIDLSSLTAALTDEESLSKGKKVYTNYCASCHGNAGEGGVGPAFADKYWIHGGKFQDRINTIINGVPEKGMVAWKGLLNDNDIAQVASYIEQFQGTNPPKLKAPEGDLYEEEPNIKTVTDSTKIP